MAAKTKAVIRPKLADFTDGIVPGMNWPGINKIPAAIAQIQAWIDSGELVSPGRDRPDPWLDWLITPERPKLVEVPKVEAVKPVEVETPRPRVVQQNDKTRWPYICGQWANRGGVIRKYHELIGDWEKDGGKLAIGSESHRLWLAGWDAEAQVRLRK